MSKSHGYVFTINNYTDIDIAECMYLELLDYVTYFIVGFEIGPENGVPHIQGYLHLSYAKTIKQIKNILTRAHLESAKATGQQFHKRYDYCKKTGDYYEYGIVPQNGVNTSGTKVIQSIHDGMCYRQLLVTYPSYMLHHSNKVKHYIEEIKPDFDTKFYVHKPVEDSITEVLNYFHSDQQDIIKGMYAVVTSLEQLESYESYLYVIFITDNFDPLYNLWPRGVPITYKYGYQIRNVKCQRFIICHSQRNLFPLYKNI